MSVTLRPVAASDLELIGQWLAEPHVARWWLTATTIDDELADIRAAMRSDDATEVLVASAGAKPIGWCQWYPWRDTPAEAAELGTGPDDIGIDYAIGAPDRVGCSFGSAMIGELVRRVRANSSAAIVCEPDAANIASRRVLEKNGFELLDVRNLSFELEPLNAIYRLPPA